MFTPVKAGLGDFMQGFYRTIVPNTTPLKEFVERGFGYSVAWAPSRMIDKAEEMLASWQKNDTHQAATRPPKMPVILVSIAKDYTPISGDFGTQIADPIEVLLPDDAKARYFEMRMVAGEIRVQLAIFAQDEPTARSLAAQFLLYLSSPTNRGFPAVFRYSGIDNKLPVQIEAQDNPAMNIDTGRKNLTVLAVDLNLRCSIPLFNSPEGQEPNDGQGVEGTEELSGYPVTQEFTQDGRPMK